MLTGHATVESAIDGLKIRRHGLSDETDGDRRPDGKGKRGFPEKNADGRKDTYGAIAQLHEITPGNFEAG